jgi:hypothetical protein
MLTITIPDISDYGASQGSQLVNAAIDVQLAHPQAEFDALREGAGVKFIIKEPNNLKWGYCRAHYVMAHDVCGSGCVHVARANVLHVATYRCILDIHGMGEVRRHFYVSPTDVNVMIESEKELLEQLITTGGAEER